MSDEIVQQIKERMFTDSDFRYNLFMAPARVLQEYALTEEEKQRFIIPNFSWVIEQRLAGVSYPRSEDALTLLKKLGIKALLTLSQEPLSADLLAKYELQVEHIPVADFTAPTLDQAKRALNAIDGFLAQDLPVAVHCGAGLGRTGTILACYLVAQGSSAEEAIAQVRASRPGSIETPEQEAIVEEMELIR